MNCGLLKKASKHIYKKAVFLAVTMVALLSLDAAAQTTYYTSNSATQPLNWDDANSWTLNSDGSGGGAGVPGQNDNVFILSGHEVIVDNINDNGGPTQSADGLGWPNVGAAGGAGSPFPGSGTQNFFHRGDMTVEEGATLTFTVRIMFDGTIFVAGTLNTTQDIIILGNFYFAPSASFSSTDDLICSGNSNTRIDIPNPTNSWTSDDIYLDHTDAFVCGLGILEIGKSGPSGNSHIINLRNGAGYNQICTNLTITGCDSGPCAGTGIYNPTPPVLTGTGGSFNYIENNIDVIDNAIGLSFGEPFLTVATITVSAGYSTGQDTLVLPPPYGIVSSFNSGTGELTLRGYGTVATWQAALRTVTFEILSDNPSTTTRTVSFQISDGFVNSNTISRDITITPVNDPPDVSTISGSSTPLAYTEGDGAVALDDQIEVNDPDDVNLESATVTLTNYVQGEDTLGFVNQNGIVGNFDAPTGVLTLTGSATLANYQAALRSITYENLSDAPDLTTRTANFMVNDGDADSPVFGRDIQITATNDAPSVTGSGTPLGYTEGDGVVIFDNTLAVSDPDNVNLSSATISISTNYNSPEDVLAFINQNGITGSFAAGVLSLSGSATLANYQTALQSITYENNSESPNTATRTVSVVVNDGSASSTAFTRDISITSVNDAPLVSGTVAPLAYTEGDGPVTFDNALTVTDVDNANLVSASISISTNYFAAEDTLLFNDQNGITGNYAAGTLTLTGTATLANYQLALRSINYENISDAPDPSTRTVSVTVFDGTDNSLVFTRDIQVTPVNDVPVVGGTLAPLAYTEGDGAVALDNALVVSDVDNLTLLSAVIDISANYSAGADVLAFSDQNGITGSLTGGTLTLTGSATLADYQLALRSITFENNSESPSILTRTVSVTVNDGTTSSLAFTRDVTITAVNDAPTVSGSVAALNYTEGDGAVLLDGSSTVTDVDNLNLTEAVISLANFVAGEDTLVFVDQNGITGSFISGVLTLSGSATLANYQTALQSVTYENLSESPDVTTRTASVVVNDGSDNSVAFDRDIVITSVNDIPVVTGTSSVLNYSEGDGAVLLDNGINVTDLDHPNLTSATVSITSNFNAGEDVLAFVDQNGISGNLAAGTLTLSGTASLANYQTALRSVTYENTSEAPNTALRTASIVLNDGIDNSLAFTRDIQITSVNDIPVVTGTLSALSYFEGIGPLIVDDAVAVSDADDTQLNGATVSITGNYKVAEDLLAFTDQNGISGTLVAGVLTLTGTASVTDYQLALQTVTYENISEAPDPSTRTISFVVNDGTDASLVFTRDIQVNPVNDIPEITGTGLPLTYTEGDGTVLLDNGIVVTDVDNPNLTSAIITISVNFAGAEDVLAFSNQNGIAGTYASGVLTLTGSATLAQYEAALRSITYENTSASPSTLNRTVTFTVNDGLAGSLEFTRDIIVNAVAEPTVITIGGGGSSLTIDYTEGDGKVAINSGLAMTDPDDINLESATIGFTAGYVQGEDVLAFVDQNGISGNFDAASGVLSLTGTASLTDYQVAIQAVTYENMSDDPSSTSRIIAETVNDGDGPSNAITVTINVTPVNDNPVVAGNSADMIYPESSGPLTIDNSITVADPDNSALQEAIIQISSNYVQDEDVLGFTAQAGVTGNFDVASGTLTISGAASLVDYQSMLQSVTYENARDQANLANRQLSFTVTDGDLVSDVFIKTIVLEEVSDPVVVYQVVTPDGDSMNDEWVIEGIEQYPNNMVRVFSRWNNLVYEKLAYENTVAPWTGTANNGITKGDLPDGTYFYTIDLGDGSDLIKGYLVLKRK